MYLLCSVKWNFVVNDKLGRTQNIEVVINFKVLPQILPEMIKGNCENSQNYLPAGQQSNTIPEGEETC
jgi:hypothetical protein